MDKQKLNLYLEILEKITENPIEPLAPQTAVFVANVVQYCVTQLKTDEDKKLFVPRLLALLKTVKPTSKQDLILQYFLGLNYNEQDGEIKEIIDFMKKYGFSIYPYEFMTKYNPTNVEVFGDYVLHQGKRLYFPSDHSPQQIQVYYNALLAEQDENSPHRYEVDGFRVEEGDVICDIGTAEGIWALSNVEKASKVYLFECEPKWISTLQKTFEPWKEKVVIINKYVSDVNENACVTLDALFADQNINLIKADIEGAERAMLSGAKELLKRSDGLKLLLCAYHRDGDEVYLKDFLEQAGFDTGYSKGYMLFIYDENLKEPFVRRGLIRAKKI